MSISLLHLLLMSLGLNLIFFILASIFKTDAFTDITYASTVAVLSLIQFFNITEYGLLSILLLAAVLIWSIRLGSYLFFRIQKIKVDHRFDNIRGSVLKFGIFWLIQAVTVWIILLPVFGIFRYNAGPITQSAMIAQVVALGLFVIGFAIELIADIQKYRFKAKNPNTFMSSGLWKYSRHPNYFGELLLWWGLALPGFFLFQGIEFLYFLGPLFLTILLLFGSGIPPMERAWKKKWGDDPAFQAYLKETSLVVPLPRRN